MNKFFQKFTILHILIGVIFYGTGIKMWFLPLSAVDGGGGSL